MGKTAIKTSIEDIVEYWESRADETELSVDFSEAKILCWRCAQERKLQRCHIVPESLGGADEPSNLVLLCGQCHAEAPNVDDPTFMWDWLRVHATSFYGMYWYERGLREYEFIYKRKAFENMNDIQENYVQFTAALKKYFRKSSIHWGQGRANPSTLAWVIRQAELEMKENDHNLKAG